MQSDCNTSSASTGSRRVCVPLSRPVTCYVRNSSLLCTQGHKYNQQTYRTYAEAFLLAWQQLHPELTAVADEEGEAAAVKLLEDQYWCV